MSPFQKRIDALRPCNTSSQQRLPGHGRSTPPETAGDPTAPPFSLATRVAPDYACSVCNSSCCFAAGHELYKTQRAEAHPAAPMTPSLSLRPRMRLGSSMPTMFTAQVKSITPCGFIDSDCQIRARSEGMFRGDGRRCTTYQVYNSYVRREDDRLSGR